MDGRTDAPDQEADGWTDAPDPDRKFTSLQEALDAYGMMEVHEPDWLPEGYALDSLDVLAMDDPFLRAFSATYKGSKCVVGIDIMSYEGEPNTLVQKTDTQPEVITQYGINFYLIEHTYGHIVAWYDGEYEYYVSSKEGKDTLWKVVESMFT